MQLPDRCPASDNVRRRLRGALSGVAMLALMVIAAARVGAQQGGTAANVLYIESNDPRPAQNSILAYRRGADGSLTPLPGSPFLTRGAGVGNPAQIMGPNDSDQNMIVTPDHRFLLAVNSGSNTVAVFRILADGSLEHISGSPFPSGGINPVSVGLSGLRLIVVNKNQDPAQNVGGALPNYVSIRNAATLGEPGFAQRPFSVTAPAGSSPSQGLVSPNGQVLFDAQFLGGNLVSFRIDADGRLIEAPGSPQKLPASVPPPAQPLGLQVHPSQPILYVGFASANQLGVYNYDEDTGALTFVNAFNNSGKALCWIVTNHAGTALFTVNSGDNSVSSYNISQPLAPAEAQHLVLRGPGNPFQQALEPSERFLYVVSQRTTTDPNDLTGNGVHILTVGQDGSLAEAPFSPMALPVPAFARPQGVVAL
jgi:6-phosphogluconolactonase (cycloisomerase 2 family)